MGKKLFSLCMALALCLGLLPTTALAAGNDTVYVGGVTLSGSTDSPAYATTDDNGTVTIVDASADKYNIKWDGSTLTLNGAKIKGAESSESLGATVGIYAFNNSGGVSLNIALKGVNEIFDSSHGIWVYSSSSGTASLDITGKNGSTLIASGSSSGILVQSNSGNAALTIQNADVTAENSISSGDGVTVRAGSISSASLSVDGGSLTATGKNENGAGIRYTFGSSSSGSGTPSLTVSGNTIVRANGGISDNSSADIQIGEGNNSGGIVFSDGIGTVYGSVTLQDDLEIKSGETLTVPDGSSLNCNGNLTNNGTINVESGGTVTGKLKGSANDIQTPSITAQPTGQKVTEGSAAMFSVTASNAQTYQWQQKATVTESEWEDITNAINASYTTAPTTTDMSGYQYRCVVKSASGVSVISNTATLTVTAPPEPEPEPEPTPPPYIPPTYAVTTPETTGGTVTVSPSRASSGRTVTITAAPDLGFALESLTVLDSRGNEIALTDKGDGKYTFTMPASRVTVEASFTPAPLPFEDVAPGAWYEGAVRYAYLHDIMEGMSATTFQPNGTLSRAMAVQIFYNLEGQPDISDENLGYPYEDVNAQAWYGDAVYWARLTGVATGYGDGTFQPTDSITRQEFAQMLYNYAKYKGYDLTAEGDLTAFPDGDSVQPWAETAMSWANGNELINGHDDGTIDAGGTAIRAQAASILMRFDQNLVEK